MEAPFKGLLKCGYCGGALGITYTKKSDRRYSYYFCVKDDKRTVSECPLVRVPGGDIDNVIIQQLSAIFRTPSLLAQTYFTAEKIESDEKAALLKRKAELEKELEQFRKDVLNEMNCVPELREKVCNIDEELLEINKKLHKFSSAKITNSDISESFNSIGALWEELFPAERYRLAHLVIENIAVFKDKMEIELKKNGIASLVQELSEYGTPSNKGENKKDNPPAVPVIKPEILPNGGILIRVPIRIKYKSNRRVVIAPECMDGANLDAESPVQNAIAQQIARGYAWMKLLETGKVANATQLSEKVGLDKSYVGRTLRLINLAPDITEALLTGAENIRISLNKLRVPLPADWQKQRELFGMER